MSTIKKILSKLSPVLMIVLLIVCWGFLCVSGSVPSFILPSPADVAVAFVNDFSLLMINSVTTLTEAFWGLLISICLAFIIATLMERFKLMYKSIYPILVITQTIPTVAIAPLLVLWMGYDMAPKITLIVIVCFFPLTVSLLDGFRSADMDTINLMRSMGASRVQIFRFIKLPSCIESFFSGLKIAVSYSIVGAVIAEWLGGNYGLGVYMTKVKKSYAFDKMFAVIIFISIISLILMGFVVVLEKKCTPWNKKH